MPYQPAIDGLRALAVLSVVFYHVGFEAFGGGFVGVDVFFVISGYLISRQIHVQVAAGRFSFATFYLRRMRRLLPALLVTIALCYVAAFLLFAPQHLERLGGAALSALLCVSNIFFFNEVGYFDAGQHLKPLLHTWSLSVEEQFYLVWPAAFLLLLRGPRWLAPGCVLLIAVLGSVAAEQVLTSNPAAAFYLSHFRAAEFAIGALLVWLIPRCGCRGLTLDILLPAGLLMIVFAAITYTRETPFPGLAALVPCIGAALVVYAAVAPDGRIVVLDVIGGTVRIMKRKEAPDG